MARFAERLHDFLNHRSSCGSSSEGLLEDRFEESREPPNYIHDFDRIASYTKTALDLYNQMLAIYPKPVNPAVLWYSAQAVKPGKSPESGCAVAELDKKGDGTGVRLLCPAFFTASQYALSAAWSPGVHRGERAAAPQIDAKRMPT